MLYALRITQIINRALDWSTLYSNIIRHNFRLYLIEYVIIIRSNYQLITFAYVLNLQVIPYYNP